MEKILTFFESVDPITGAMFKLPEKADAQLEQKVAKETDASLTIALLSSVPKSQRAELIQLN